MGSGEGGNFQKQIAAVAEDLKSRNYKKVCCNSSNKYDAVLLHVCVGVKAESSAWTS